MLAYTKEKLPISRLNFVHPASSGRVILLDPPYQLPPNMDLRGIAGIVLKREQNLAMAKQIADMPDEEFKLLQFSGARFRPDIGLTAAPDNGPLKAPPLIPEPYRTDVESLALSFHRLTGAKDIGIHLRASNARTFHMDGAGNRPSWRLTYAFNGDQTDWHRALPATKTSSVTSGGTAFPLLDESAIGEKDRDYFRSEGALIFRTFSNLNGLFHRTPPGQPDRRLIVTFDGSGPYNQNCGSCPFPCRAPQ